MSRILCGSLARELAAFTLPAMADGAMGGTHARGGGTAWRESKLGVVSGSDRLVERAIEDGPVERGVGEHACACMAEGTMP